MKLTKYSHACFTVEKDGQSLVVDPGNWSMDLVIPHNVVGIIVTHEHADHMDKIQLKKIVDANPEAIIYAHGDVTAQLQDFAVKAVTVDEVVEAGNFSLEFIGGTHATIHSSIPGIANLGVIIDGLLYFPGDSFDLPHKPIETLALPAAAPWMRMSEAMDFLAHVKPKRAFPAHDAILSDGGKALSDKLLGSVAETIGTSYARLQAGEVLEIEPSPVSV